ncbi:hypothetical protein FJY90_02855 [Candidatus Gottesmanbacteria bacterium]|nr:hypothetical protein [Candidatus Gottesmanbacteria bacterium]
MKVKITEELIGFDGKPIYQAVAKRDDNGKPARNELGMVLLEDKVMTWREVVYNALESRENEREVLNAEQKIKCGQIERKLYESDEPDLSVEERAFLIERIRKTIVSPMICELASEFFGDKSGKETKV